MNSAKGGIVTSHPPLLDSRSIDCIFPQFSDILKSTPRRLPNDKPVSVTIHNLKDIERDIALLCVSGILEL